ncbi:hopanoid-associated sugar epimerase [Candidatus Auribacterota bacterium]
MKAFVTGSTGFVGSAVVRELIESGYKVKVLVRKNSDHKNLKGLGCELFYGDLRDKESLRKGIKGCGVLFHVAAHYELWHADPALPYQINVAGTINLLEAAMEAGVMKVVYTSSVSTLGICAEKKVGTEDTPVDIKYIIGHYKKSKYLAEKEVMRFVKKGLPVCIVNPSTPIGERDIKPTPTGKLIVDYLNSKMYGYVETGLNIIDVHDVARGHILALEKGKIGHKYILGNKNLTLKEIFKMLEKVSGKPAPKMKIPYPVALFAGYSDNAVSRLLRKPPSIPLDGVKMARKKMFFDPTKAVDELGLPQSPVEHSFKKACDWFIDNGYIKN